MITTRVAKSVPYTIKLTVAYDADSCQPVFIDIAECATIDML